MKHTPFSTTLKNGASVLIREVTPDDRHLLEIGLEHLSARAKYFRFLGAHKELSQRELDKFTATNSPDHVAVGAVLNGTAETKPIGIARYIRLPEQPHVAEIAITIADNYQRMGLGSHLLRVLAKFAKRNGISEFNALVHIENIAMLGMLGRIDGAKISRSGTEVDIRFPVAATSNQPTAPSLKKKLKFKGPDQPVSV